MVGGQPHMSDGVNNEVSILPKRQLMDEAGTAKKHAIRESGIGAPIITKNFVCAYLNCG